MDGFSPSVVGSAGGATPVDFNTRQRSILCGRRSRSVAFRRKQKFTVFAGVQEPELNEWEEKEVRVGRIVGEDAGITLAKIKARRLDSNASVHELEKSFYRNKGKLPDIQAIPRDWAKPSREVPSVQRQAVSSVDGLNSVRPIPKKGIEYEGSNKLCALETRKPYLPVWKRKPVVDLKRRAVPDVILRKTATSKEEGVEDKASGLRFKPNLSLKFGNAQSPERFSDMRLLRKLESVTAGESIGEKGELPGDAKTGVVDDIELKISVDNIIDKSDMTLLRKLQPTRVNGYSYNNQELSGGAKAKVMDDMKLKKTVNGYIDKSDRMMLKKPENIYKKQELSSREKDRVMNDAELMMVKEETEVLQNYSTRIKNHKAIKTQPRLERKNVQFGNPEVRVNDDIEQNGSRGTSESSEMGSATKDRVEILVRYIDKLLTNQAKKDSDSDVGLKQFEHIDVGFAEEETGPREQSATNSVNSDFDMFSGEAALQGKPKRFDQPVRKASKSARAGTDFAYLAESYRSDVGVELESSSAESPSKDLEDTYWTRAEELLDARELEEVELIRPSSGGFIVSFGPLLGFLPYTNLTTGWKFIAFEPWLRSNGLDPSIYRGNLGTARSCGGGISQNMKLENLLKIYEQEKSKFLSSLVGQSLRVCVKLADRKSRKLIFSLKSKKDNDVVEKKKNLMAKLRIGDTVKCHVTSIAYFGVFVEVEGVPALIHQTELSCDATLDPSSYFKIGQVLEAKVHQLNFELERIFLSLRELTPDPLSDTLESVVGDTTRLMRDYKQQKPSLSLMKWNRLRLLLTKKQCYSPVSIKPTHTCQNLSCIHA